MQKEKEILEEFILYAQKTKNRKSNGKCEPPMGILMYGTAGTGKTILARAVAKETNLPFFEISSSIFSQKYKGVEKDWVINLFKSARKEAQNNNGAIIFLDECDTIFTDLGSLEANSDTANVVNQFKTELNSTENDVNHPVFIIAATNHFQKLDETIKSRFDYKTEVKVGDFKDRKAFLEFMIQKRGNEYSEKAKDYLVEDINNKLDELSFLRGEEIKSNRTLENFLKAIARANERAINISNTNRGNSFKISIEDIQKAYTKVYNNKTINYIEENKYDPDKKLIKTTQYQPDGKTINYIEDYNSDEKLIKKTFYNSDGKNIDYIFRNEYNSDKKIIKTTYFQSDDKTINYIEEYDSNEKPIKTTFYNSDVQIINCF
ncbi:MAG: ATP-dependent zinc metalloprotease FtsH [Candidatus Phytoplasma pruni]